MKYIFILSFMCFFMSCSTSKVYTKLPKKMNPKARVKPKETTSKKVKHTSLVKKKRSKPISKVSTQHNYPSHLKHVWDQDAQSVALFFPKKKISVPNYQTGWSVQLVASSDKVSVETILNKVKVELGLSARIVSDNEVYKLRSEIFAIRVKADQLSEELKRAGYASSWVVKEMYESENKEDKLFYTLQAGVYSTRISANKMKKNLEVTLKYPIVIKEENNLFKVFIGKSETRSEIEKLSEEVKSKGFKAFIRQLLM